MRNLPYGSIVYIGVCVIGFWAMRWYDFEGDYVASITTAGVGYVAYFVYSQGKRNLVQDTAKMLILDIRNAEEAIEGVRASPSPVTWARLEVADNNWSRYKQLFVGRLNTDEFKRFEQFFHGWTQIVKLKTDAESFGIQELAAKAGEAQKMLAHLDKDASDYSECRKKIIAIVSEENWMFDPEAFGKRIDYFMKSIQVLSGTTGFAKIRALAGLNE